jgi:hypothetical protein
MGDHFFQDCIENDGEQSFVPEPWYNPYGDCIVFKMADEAIITDRVDDVLTLYRSCIDNRPIGFQIKCVVAMIRKLGWHGLEATCDIDPDRLGSVSVSAVLLAAYEVGPKSVSRRSGYAQAFQLPASGKSLRREDLQLA